MEAATPVSHTIASVSTRPRPGKYGGCHSGGISASDTSMVLTMRCSTHSVIASGRRRC